ncbi:MAG: (p)ppGpp synthetase [Bacteroidales bacterium]|nr:(p)ppGpp synthetase [Bacteroidales bacterium]
MKKNLKSYDENYQIFDNFRGSLELLLNILLKKNKIAVHSVTSRLKERDSLEKKVRKKNKYNSISEITDIVGLRIITYFEDEVDKISELISTEFDIDKQNSLDKRIKDFDRFGYSSLHYVIKLSKERIALAEYSDFKDYKCEIQIRSILQHAWAEIEHDIGYKSRESIPDIAKRNFSRVAALLETADLEFTKLKESLNNYSESISTVFKKNPQFVELNDISLEYFANNNSLIFEIDSEIAKKNDGKVDKDYSFLDTYISQLNFLNIYNVKELETELIANREKIISFSKEFMSIYYGDTIEANFAGGVCITYLSYVLLAKTKSMELMNKFGDRFFRDERGSAVDYLIKAYENIK